MKFSTAIRKALRLRVEHGTSGSCLVCNELIARRADAAEDRRCGADDSCWPPCGGCPLARPIRFDYTGIDGHCVNLAKQVARGNQKALAFCEEIALACEMQGD